jgi:hypothetical protein
MQGLPNERQKAFLKFMLGNRCLSLTDKSVFAHLWKNRMPSGEFYISIYETSAYLRMSRQRVYWSLKRISQEVMVRPERMAEQRFDDLLTEYFSDKRDGDA